MISSHLFLLVAVGILCYFAPWISGHAYFSYPTPRNIYCTNSTCTSNGALGSQGPVWGLLANSTLATASPTSQTTCNGSTLLAAAPLGNTYDPGFQGTTAASWLAGSLQTLQIFISQIHSPENQIIYPTDGWQIRYRDGAQAGSTFSPIPFTYVNVSTVASVGPDPAIGFQLGQTVLATITVPSGVTNDGIFQFFWRNNEVATGVMWLSCADVTITALDTTTAPSTVSAETSSYFCLVNNLTVEFALSSSSHSASQPSSNCSVLLCPESSTNNSSNCRTSSTPCYNYRTINNVSYCAPGSLCSILEPCNSITGECASNTSVCIINSCCVPQAVCLPLSWTSLCPSQNPTLKYSP